MLILKLNTVDSDQARDALCDWPELAAWTLMPSGVTSWSSDDWREITSRALRRH